MVTELKQRLLWGFVLGFLGVFVISIGSFTFACVAMAMCSIGCYEAYIIITKANNVHRDIVDDKSLKVAFKACGIIYLPFLSLVYLRFCEGSGFFIILWIASVVWSVDVFAYFFGKMIGGPKLCPNISPKKTWSGFICGVLMSSLVSFLMYLALEFKTNLYFFAILSVTLPVLAQIGDLLESKFKRVYNVKDSGTIIPGHGGILDRMDGFLITAPLLAALHIGFQISSWFFKTSGFLY